MSCEILFPWKSKENINLLSAELAQSVVNVKKNGSHARFA